jgi:hypothetical protein
MRTPDALALIAAVAFSFAATAAQAAGNAEISTEMTTVEVVGDGGHKFNETEIHGVKGSYKLDDGSTLVVSSAHRKLYAEVNGVRKEIVAKSPTVFASPDDAIRLTFDNASAAYEVTLSKVAP